MSDDIYQIVSRVKNHIAKENMAYSKAGEVLVNYFTLFLSQLYDFSDSLPNVYKDKLNELLSKNEILPKNVISVSMPKGESLFEQLEDSVPYFENNKSAYEFYKKEYEQIGNKYEKSGDEFWFESENSERLTDDQKYSLDLGRKLQILTYLIEKYDE